MKRLAIHVAMEVSNFDCLSIRSMVSQFGWKTVHDFFESYQRVYHADVSKQLEWIEEIVWEMN